MNDDQNLNPQPASDDTEDRREIIKKLGKYAAYLAPFTVAAVSAKANGSGPAPKPLKR